MYTHSENFIKTPLANFSKHSWQSLPHQIKHQDIASVHEVDKDRGTLANSEPQTLWLPIKQGLNFSQCHKYHLAIGDRIEREKLE